MGQVCFRSLFVPLFVGEKQNQTTAAVVVDIYPEAFAKEIKIKCTYNTKFRMLIYMNVFLPTIF